MEKKVTIKEVLSMLEKGMSREEIANYFDLNPNEAKTLFKHEKIKGIRKNKYRNNLLIIDEEEIQEETIE